jgi:hypothetical protein
LARQSLKKWKKLNNKNNKKIMGLNAKVVDQYFLLKQNCSTISNKQDMQLINEKNTNKWFIYIFFWLGILFFFFCAIIYLFIWYWYFFCIFNYNRLTLDLKLNFTNNVSISFGKTISSSWNSWVISKKKS